MTQKDLEARAWGRKRMARRAIEEWHAGKTNNALRYYASSDLGSGYFRALVEDLQTALEYLNENRRAFMEADKTGYHSMCETLQDMTGLPRGALNEKTPDHRINGEYRHLIDALTELAASAEN